MNQETDFVNSFHKFSKLNKFLIGLQCVSLIFTAYLFIEIGKTSSQEPMGAAIVEYVFGYLFIAFSIFLLLLFSVGVFSLNAERKAFKWIGIFGIIACVLPGLSLIQFVNFLVTGNVKVIILFICDAVLLAIKPVYYFMMSKEVTDRFSKSHASCWKRLFVIGILFILCLGAMYVFSEIHDSHVGGVITDDYFDTLDFWARIVKISTIVSIIVFLIRMVYEFICTGNLEKTLLAENGKENALSDVQD